MFSISQNGAQSWHFVKSLYVQVVSVCTRIKKRGNNKQSCMSTETWTCLSSLCVLFSHSPVTVPAEPAGFPCAACQWIPILWGWIRASAPASPRRPGIGRFHRHDGKAESERRAVHVSKQQSGGRDGSLPCRPNNWSHSYFDLGSPALRQAATTCWWHVKEMNKLSQHELPKSSSSW